MPRSEAQKRADKIYESKHMSIRIRSNGRNISLIKAEASRQGQNMSEYILQAIKERMARDKAARSEELNQTEEEE